MRKTIIVLFFILLGAGLLGHVFTADRSFSPDENRVLQTFPKLSFSSLFSGDFMADVETYIADQFPQRQQFVRMKSAAEQAIGKTENNGILFGDDGYLFERFPEAGEQASQNVEAVNAFARQLEDMSIAVMLAPSSLAIYPEKGPNIQDAQMERESIDRLYDSFDERVEKLAVTELLLKEKEAPIYFKTDHHWTMLGAYEGYVAAGEAFGFDVLGRDQFVRDLVADDFYGSYFRRANSWFTSPDVMEYLRAEEMPAVSLTFDDGSVRDSLVRPDLLDSHDMYRFFLGGNYGLITVQSDVANGKKLLLVKDSFAHVLVPFFVHHYEEIHVVDLRYFKDSAVHYAREHGFDDVLIMYQAGNFIDDVAVSRLRFQ